MATIIYTHTDEAPLLATYSFLPIVSAYAQKAGVRSRPVTSPWRGASWLSSAWPTTRWPSWAS